MLACNKLVQKTPGCQCEDSAALSMSPEQGQCCQQELLALLLGVQVPPHTQSSVLSSIFSSLTQQQGVTASCTSFSCDTRMLLLAEGQEGTLGAEGITSVHGETISAKGQRLPRHRELQEAAGIKFHLPAG